MFVWFVKGMFIPFAAFSLFHPLCCCHTHFHFLESASLLNQHFGFFCYSLRQLKTLKEEILWNSVCLDSDFKEWLRKASPSPPVHKELCVFLSWSVWSSAGQSKPRQRSHIEAVLWLNVAFPEELNRQGTLPAFLPLAFWCHSVINKEN